MVARLAWPMAFTWTNLILVDQTRAVKRGGVPGVTTPGPGPKRGPDTNCYKFTSTARYEVKLIAD